MSAARLLLACGKFISQKFMRNESVESVQCYICIRVNDMWKTKRWNIEMCFNAFQCVGMCLNAAQLAITHQNASPSCVTWAILRTFTRSALACAFLICQYRMLEWFAQFEIEKMIHSLRQNIWAGAIRSWVPRDAWCRLLSSIRCNAAAREFRF